MKPGETANQALDGILPGDNHAVLNNKRKAEDAFEAPRGTVMKNGARNGHISRTSPSINRSTNANTSSKRSVPSSSEGVVPYHRPGRPDPSPSIARVVPTVSTNLDRDIAKVPKKGSYAEIMARAKASQSRPPPVGVISHKPRDKIAISHKKEMKLKKNAIKNKKLAIKAGESRPGSSDSLSSSSAPMSSDLRKNPQSVYKGTAKAHVKPTYKGTMKAGFAVALKPSLRDRDSQVSRNHYDEYAATDEDDLDDVEGDDDGSDESEDMEAGFSDVEQEEDLAAKAAKKEDEKEARLEAKLKSEKEERKKRLETMAKKAKPQRY